ncbi:MAG: DUF420 domain-containing protein [Candidatus Omnitrophica bacterium]|nr:DUF420 domain-containing protein [Candidatus Omnitrophota bacterium]
MEINHILLPTINALLNSLATMFLIGGALAIRNRNFLLHKKFMLAALTASALFLTCYVANRIIAGGITHYQGKGISRSIYFFILATHTPLAMIILPCCLTAVWHALHHNYKGHTAITRWLLPVWFYVSVTGVLIYLMLYVL